MTTHETIVRLVKSGSMARLSGNQLAVLLVYVAHANVDGHAWPALQTVCELSGIASHQNVCVARKALMRLGLMSLIRRTQASTVYQVHIGETVQKMDSLDATPTTLETVQKLDTLAGDPAPLETVQKMDSPKNGQSKNRTVQISDCPENGPQTVQKMDLRVSSFWTQKHAIEASQEAKSAARCSTSSNRVHDSKPKPLNASNEPPGFTRFWSAYPNTSRRTNKATCLKRWISDGLEARAEEIFRHVEASKRSDQWVRGMEPLTATYLNQKRYDSPPPGTRDQTRANGHRPRQPLFKDN